LCCPFLIPYCLSLIAYLRADSCPLQSPGISVYPTRYKPVRALAKF
jgi:hypothetical protein